jgi:tetratricopeptide (TPR) repeat protein
LAEHVKLLFRLWWQPAAAMGDILDRGSLLFASLAVIAATLLVQSGLPDSPVNFYTPLLVLAVVYVPGVLLVAGLFGTFAGVAVAFRRDYSPMLTCAAMAWSAALLPMALAVRTAPPQVLQLLAGLAGLYLTVLMFFAVRTVFGAANGSAAAIAALSWIPLAAAIPIWGALMSVLHLLASPFFLFYAFYYLGGEFSRLGEGLRNRQNYRRMLEAAAVNPHDGEAQYQLGLIHQQRRQTGEALRRFRAAVAIDPTETDAHFQLGRIAFEQQRFEDSLAHFQTVLKQNEKHRSSEVHRELGAVYVMLGRFADAEPELSLYTDRREYDPEGLYYYGRAIESLGRPAEARAVYERAIEAAATAPHYRRHLVARWSRLAQKQAGRLKKSKA